MVGAAASENRMVVKGMATSSVHPKSVMRASLS